MNIQSIFAITDFSTLAEQGLERAALLAQTHAAKLSVMYATEVPNPKFSDPFARLEQRARQLARRHNINVKAVDRTGGMVEDILKQCKRANLLVMDPRCHRSPWQFWQGSTRDQMLNHSPCPVLVVKQAPLRPYERLLVALDRAETSDELVRHANSFSRGAELELFHTLRELNDTQHRTSAMSTDAASAYRKSSLMGTHNRVFRDTDASHTRRNRVASLSGRAEPARLTVVQQEASKADLIVVGKARRSALHDFLVGSAAQRITQWSSSDILVVPSGYRSPSSAAAAVRIHAMG
jgi:nucleotide-binding universal stress UspA family protein